MNIKYININGNILRKEENSVPASSRAIYYGDGCFETFVSYKGKFLSFEDHFDRLLLGLEYLEMKTSFNQAKLKAEILRLIESNELENEHSVIRVQCFREGNSGYFNISDQSGYIISIRPLRSNKADISLKSVSVKAIPSIALERKVKLSNSINYIKAAQEAKKKGGDDALMLTINHKVSETTIANIFWVKGDHIFTPSLDCDLLPGVTRSIVLKLINESSEYFINEGEFLIQDIYEADSVFCCNSVMEIKSVSNIDSQSYETSHPVVEMINERFQDYKSMHLT